MLANSGDSFLVFTALLGDTRSWLDGVVVGALVAMSVLWVRIAAVVTEHPRLRDPLRVFARFGLPILLVCVGLYILLDTPTDTVVAPWSGRGPE
jgi:cadmium resistance protein CadD (predicted permease)